MPHAAVKLIPGVNQNETPALNQAGISVSNLIRFIYDPQLGGLIQKLGGWTKYYPNPIPSIARALFGWEDTNAVTHLAVGMQNKPGTYGSELAVITNGTLVDITPQYVIDDAPPVASSTSGSPYIVITDTVVENITAYDSVYITTHIAIGGIVLFGIYPCDPNGYIAGTSYTVGATDVLGNLLAATSTSSSPTLPQFATTSGSNSVTVTLTNHGYSVGSTFPVLVTTVIGGITFYGNYVVQSVTSSSVFVINGSNLASSTTTGYLNRGNAQYIYSYGIGAIPTGTGYGIGGYGTGGYGTGTAVVPSTGYAVSATNWSLDNWGQVLISCPVDPVTTLTTTSTSGSGSIATLGYSGTSYFIPVGSTVQVTGVTPNTYNGSALVVVPAASFTGSITGSTLTVTSSVTGPGIAIGQALTGNGVASNTTILFGSGTSWGLSTTLASPISGVAMNTISPNAVSVTSTATGSMTVAGTVTLNIPEYQPIYQYDPNSGSPTATIIPQAPPVNDGFFVAMPQRQIIAWGSTFTGIQDPLLIRWCDVNNYNSWIATVINQAGSYRIPKGSKIVGAIQASQQGLIWTDLAVWSMQYIGPPYVYSFNEIGTSCGLISRKAAASFNGVVYWMGKSQFFSLTGGGVTPVPCPLWDVIFQNLDFSNLDKIRVAVNSLFGEITWYYPTVNSGEVNEYIKYNAYLQTWDFGTLARSAWIDQSVLGAPIGADPNSLYIYQHENSNGQVLFDADGQAMNSYFTTGYFTMSEADVKTFVDQVWPDMKWGLYNGTQNATINLTFNYVDYAGQTPQTTPTYALTQATQYVSPRFRGRLTSITLGSNDVGSFWRIGNIRYRLQPDGKF